MTFPSDFSVYQETFPVRPLTEKLFVFRRSAAWAGRACTTKKLVAMTSVINARRRNTVVSSWHAGTIPQLRRSDISLVLTGGRPSVPVSLNPQRTSMYSKQHIPLQVAQRVHTVTFRLRAPD